MLTRDCYFNSLKCGGELIVYMCTREVVVNRVVRLCQQHSIWARTEYKRLDPYETAIAEVMES